MKTNETAGDRLETKVLFLFSSAERLRSMIQQGIIIQRFCFCAMQMTDFYSNKLQPKVSRYFNPRQRNNDTKLR